VAGPDSEKTRGGSHAFTTYRAPGGTAAPRTGRLHVFSHRPVSEPTLPQRFVKTRAWAWAQKNFITEILDNYAALNRDRKQEFIDYSNRLVAEQPRGATRG